MWGQWLWSTTSWVQVFLAYSFSSSPFWWLSMLSQNKMPVSVHPMQLRSLDTFLLLISFSVMLELISDTNNLSCCRDSQDFKILIILAKLGMPQKDLVRLSSYGLFCPESFLLAPLSKCVLLYSTLPCKKKIICAKGGRRGLKINVPSKQARGGGKWIKFSNVLISSRYAQTT